jgi:hypothetical protein
MTSSSLTTNVERVAHLEQLTAPGAGFESDELERHLHNRAAMSPEIYPLIGSF